MTKPKSKAELLGDIPGEHKRSERILADLVSQKEEASMNLMTQANKNGWDGLAKTHYQNYHIGKLLAGTPLLNEVIRAEVGDVRGKSLVHLLCHIGTDTLSWALLGARVSGIDISAESLKYARLLAEKMGIEADFIESDVMDVIQKVKKKHDIVFSSTGVLCWLPDIRRYAQTVRHLLHDDGFFYIFDGHPFRSVLLDETGSYSSNTIQGDYFRKEVWQYDHMGDYTDAELRVETPSYEWHWTMGEIVSAFCAAGMRIVFLHEFPQYFYSGYTPYDVEDEKVERYPCTFSLKAMAK
ncbi:MAG: class I SAM-dependent methyltransferase [Anaerolineales bacterium]|nr:class I SAM-dependent methyltransferase [Anaerolineales bacterium]